MAINNKESEPRPEQNLKITLENFAQEVKGFLKFPKTISSQIEKAFSLSDSLEKIFIQENCRFMEDYGLYKSLSEKGGFKTRLSEEDLKKEPGAPKDIRMVSKFIREDTKLKITYSSKEKYVLGHSRNKTRDSSILFFTSGDRRGRQIEFLNLGIFDKDLRSNIIKASVYKKGKIIEEEKLFLKKSASGYSIEFSSHKINPKRSLPVLPVRQ